MGPSSTPIKSCILNKNLQNTPPFKQENISQLACSRLAKVAYNTDNCPVEFWIWPVEDSKNKLLEVYLFYKVFGSDQKDSGKAKLYMGVVHINTYRYRFLNYKLDRVWSLYVYLWLLIKILSIPYNRLQLSL